MKLTVKKTLLCQIKTHKTAVQKVHDFHQLDKTEEQ